MTEFLRRDDLSLALHEIAEDAESQASYNYDTVACARLDAKAEICRALIEKLGLPKSRLCARCLGSGCAGCDLGRVPK